MAGASLAHPKLNSIRTQKLLILTVILGALVYGLINREFGEIVISAISDAYIQVTSFVAATLFLFYTIERVFKFNLSKKLSESGNLQVFLLPFWAPFQGVVGQSLLLLAMYLGH